MSGKVTITVELNRGDITLTKDTPVGDNPLYSAAQVENAIAKMGRTLISQVVALQGDIRDRPDAPPIVRSYETPLTGRDPATAERMVAMTVRHAVPSEVVARRVEDGLGREGGEAR